MRISIIVAMAANNRVIGIDNKLPWHLPADLAHFKQTTLGKPILMGRKTFDSIGKALPGRHNIVLSTQTDLSLPGCTVAHSLEEALSVAGDCEELMIIGGAKIYEALLPRVDRLYLTLVDANVDGDSFFPELATQQWQEVSREDHAADVKNPHDYSFVVLDKQ